MASPGTRFISSDVVKMSYAASLYSGGYSGSPVFQQRRHFPYFPQPSFIQDNDFFMGRLQLHSLRAAALRHAEPAAAVQIRQSAFLPEAGREFQFASGSHGGKKYKQHPVPAVFQKSQERNRIPRCFQNPDGRFHPTEKQRC